MFSLVKKRRLEPEAVTASGGGLKVTGITASGSMWREHGAVGSGAEGEDARLAPRPLAGAETLTPQEQR